MASVQQINIFNQATSEFEKVDLAKVIRPELGAVSLTEAEPMIRELKDKIAFARPLVDSIPDSVLSNINGPLSAIAQNFSQIIQQQNQEFVNARTTHISQLSGLLDGIRIQWAPFVTTAIEKSGILARATSLEESLTRLAQEELNALKKSGEEILKLAQEKADQIEKRARLTAAKISVQAAQEQFDNGQKELNKQAYTWSALAASAIIGFVVFAIFLLRNPPTFDPKVGTQILIAQDTYLTVIRVAILTAIGAVSTFFLRMARAHFHMAAYNAHRRRVANSMTAFVEAASSPEQRDTLLGRLVDAVVQFGDSGILDKQSDGISMPMIAIDAVSKTLQTKD